MTIPIPGDFADYRTVKSRKVLQIIIEVPIEEQARVFEALGYPNFSEGNPVAIAPLGGLQEPEKPKAEPKPAKPKERFEDMAPSKQAGILCGDTYFQRFLKERYPSQWATVAGDDKPAAVVRHLCYVSSRSHINDDRTAQQHWSGLLSEYRDYQRTRAETARYQDSVR